MPCDSPHRVLIGWPGLDQCTISVTMNRSLTDIGDTNAKHQRCDDCSADQAPDSPFEKGAASRDTQKRHCNTNLDEHGSDGIKVLGNIEELQQCQHIVSSSVACRVQ